VEKHVVGNRSMLQHGFASSLEVVGEGVISSLIVYEYAEAQSMASD